MSSPVIDHPEWDALEGYVQGTLDDARRLAVERHLDRCLQCRAFVDHAGASDPEEGPPSDSANTSAFPAFPQGKDPGGTARIRGRKKQLLEDHPRYRLLRPLGEGGMGTVYLAEHRMMKRQVALKILRSGALKGPSAIQRFHREVEAAARLSHPNIVQAHDAEQFGELHMLVMEYVEGADLAAVMDRNGPLPLEQAADYIRQAALGLQHAHEQGMVHRDLKPSNLMLTSSGQVKILDFGLARLDTAEDGAGSLTQTGVVMGTPDFIAPEQARNMSRVDIRADIYSLGCTFYYLLVGHEPFTSGTTVEKLLAHQTELPPAVTSLRTDLPLEVNRVLDRMMAKAPEDRYQTPAEVAEALDLLLSPDGRTDRIPEKVLARISLVAAAEPAPVAEERTTRSPGQRSTRRRRRSGTLRKPPVTVGLVLTWCAGIGLGLFLLLVLVWAIFPPVWYLVPPPPWGDQWLKDHRRRPPENDDGPRDEPPGPRFRRPPPGGKRPGRPGGGPEVRLPTLRSEVVHFHAANRRSISSPTRWLFSGWNCVAKTFSCQIDEQNGPA